MSRGYVDPNFPNPMGPNDAPIIIYGYTPSLIVAALGVALFLLALPIHGFLLYRHRSWYFTTVTIGVAMEIVGYVFRLFSSQKDPYSVRYFVIQYFFIVVAPVFFSAAIYAVVSVMIGRYGRAYAPLSPKLILGVFITADVVTTMVQIAGAALVGVAYSNKKDPTSANNILLAGLAVQVASFFLFLVVLAWTLMRARASPAKISTPFVAALVVATLAVYLRTCFRLAETAQGLEQTLSTHEVYFACLEFLPIVVAVFVLAWFHPGRYLKRGSQEHKLRNGNVEAAAELKG